ncbi:unnamed protein product [Clonostachys rosea f. rosea IK726]|uniref:Uncharacterized protein n=1 Tax=Clonostachys rosea f. rosea IK726 TaxID=1349383 RepID=A0ACA9U9X7_BIOOC|nr:unnamed protein product [Clonostachys rosea f. rosea IK726]
MRPGKSWIVVYTPGSRTCREQLSNLNVARELVNVLPLTKMLDCVPWIAVSAKAPSIFAWAAALPSELWTISLPIKGSYKGVIRWPLRTQVSTRTPSPSAHFKNWQIPGLGAKSLSGTSA